MEKKLFINRFNPTSLNSYVLPSRIKDGFKDGIVSHSLFYGTHGIGKSSLGKLLTQGYPFLYINAGKEGRIDVLRNDILNFCTNVQLQDNGEKSDIKYVMLDEIDGVSPAFFDALKGFMDTYGDKVRFIATSNHVNKIPSAIKDRFERINFNAESNEEEEEIKKMYSIRIYHIIKSLNIKISREALDYIRDRHFPSFRGALQDLQRLHKSGVTDITIEDIKKKSYEFKDLYDLILKGGSPESIHILLMADYATKTLDVLESLDEPFIQYIKQNHPAYNFLIPRICIEVAKYQSMIHMVIDPAITMKACVYTLMGYAKKGSQ
jgi:DNA polymerase III delta prime subunit